MAWWQVVMLAAAVLLPLVLLASMHPARERLSTRGVPMQREWRPAPPDLPVDDHH